ncbi:hypothetical protein PspLS_08280 [Pyricularia sp. CBS 133598]|nr:hypothetical protein PspLS_08280 [Pyricularia sp. CBS 133598]
MADLSHAIQSSMMVSTVIETASGFARPALKMACDPSFNRVDIEKIIVPWHPHRTDTWQNIMW